MEPSQPEDNRPILAVSTFDAEAAVTEFAAGLQAGHDQRDANLLHDQFARDVVWGSPYGALIEGYEELHPIHVRFQEHNGEGPRVRYEVRNIQPISGDVVIAHIARLMVGSDDQPVPPSSRVDQPFSELAMYETRRGRCGHRVTVDQQRRLHRNRIVRKPASGAGGRHYESDPARDL